MKKRLAALACLASNLLLADGVTRSVEPVPGGCRITLAWEFSGKVESDLIIEERFAPGWSVVDSTVPFGSLDASWLSGHVARFAVKPSLLAGSGSISFTVVPGGSTGPGTVAGDWKMYLSGSLKKGRTGGEDAIKAGVSGTLGGPSCATAGSGEGAVAVAIKSFKIVSGAVELEYSGVAKPGILAVEGCEGLGGGWKEIARLPVAAGDGKVSLGLSSAGASRFFRMKLFTEE